MHPILRKHVIIGYHHLRETLDDRALGKTPDKAVAAAYMDYATACNRIGEPHFRFSDVITNQIPADYPDERPGLPFDDEHFWYITRTKAVS